MVDAWIGVVGVRRLVATSVALTALLIGGCGSPTSPTPALPATGTFTGPNPCQLLTLADVRQVYPAASTTHVLPVNFIVPEKAMACGYATGLPVGSKRPAAVGVTVLREDDAAWARAMTDAVNSGFAIAVPGLDDAIISVRATGGSVHRGAWSVQIGFESPSDGPSVVTLFLGIVASRL